MTQNPQPDIERQGEQDLLHVEPERVDIKDPDEKVARSLTVKAAAVTAAIAVLLALFQLYTAYAGSFPDLIQRSTHIGLAMVLGFMMYAARDRSPLDRFSVPDFILVLLGATVCTYAAVNYDRI